MTAFFRTIVFIAAVVCLSAFVLEAGPYAYGNPDDAEQYMLEVINAIRSDPAAWAAAYGISLNEGLTAGTIIDVPKQPMPMNSELLNAARAHAIDMRDNDFFSHTGTGGSTPSTRAVAQGYSALVGENIAMESVGGMTEAQGIDSQLQLLFVDAGIAGRGHRLNLLNNIYAECGLAFEQDPNWQGFNIYLMTQDFGADWGPFILGVCYNDANMNGSYDVGEGIAGVDITAVGVAATVTAANGGYAIAAVGTFNVIADDGGVNFNDVTVTNVTIGTENAKLDFEAGAGALNAPPAVDVGADQLIALPNTANLAGAVADDNQPLGKLWTTWTKTSGPGEVVFATGSAAMTVTTFGMSGTYVVRLTARDGGMYGISELTVDVTDNRDNDGDGLQNDLDADDDNDGIADAADTDRDGDGYANDYELANGSDPNDSTSRPVVNNPGGGGGGGGCFLTSAGR